MTRKNLSAYDPSRKNRPLRSLFPQGQTELITSVNIGKPEIEDIDKMSPQKPTADSSRSRKICLRGHSIERKKTHAKKSEPGLLGILEK